MRHRPAHTYRGADPGLSLRIFLSYAFENNELATRVAMNLRLERHRVFHAGTDLQPSEAYDQRIREEIAACDLLVVLVSPEMVSPGRYALSELTFAKKRWPHPHGHVLPVLVPPTRLDALDPYLRAVTVLQVPGDIAAEVAGTVATIARQAARRRVRSILAAAVAVVIVAVATVGAVFKAAWRGWPDPGVRVDAGAPPGPNAANAPDQGIEAATGSRLGHGSAVDASPGPAGDKPVRPSLTGHDANRPPKTSRVHPVSGRRSDTPVVDTSPGLEDFKRKQRE